jgi:hypothetical protein
MSAIITNGKQSTEWATTLPPGAESQCQRIRNACTTVVREYERSGSDADVMLFAQLIVAELEAKLV